MRRLTLLFIGFFILWSDVLSDKVIADSSVRQSSIRIRIDRLSIIGSDQVDTLEVFLDAGEREIAGFNLKIAVGSPQLLLENIFPGEIPRACNWEFFSSAERPTPSDGHGLSQLWQVTALAKSSPGSDRPDCLGLGREASILKLVLSRTPIPNSDKRTEVLPIFFYWESCRDNVLSDISGTSLVVSSEVFGHDGDTLTLLDAEFPTGGGAPASCINPQRRNHPERRILFRNGGVDFYTDLDSTNVKSD